ncbi:MAG: serine hydrolase [Alphaproteobacteria bacterium]|nr:serine hydrolase [Alphaproteobacteria bacterium]MBU2380882.1 serine hydrolase [Alphaproteobacteria bacterium]
MPPLSLRTVLATAFLFTLTAPAVLRAQDRADFPEAMDAFARRAMERTEAVPGMAVAVVDAQGPVYAGGFGVSDVETRAPVTADTRFYIASATKSFTALAISAMAARGELNLDAPLATWSEGSGVPVEIASRVTLTDLLSHRSGVDNGPIAFRLAFSGDWTPETLWRLTAETGPGEVAPGTFDYTNSGYNLATVLIEHRWGRDWRDLVQDEVLRPLGMTHTTALIDEARGAGETVAAGHLGRAPGHSERSYLQKTDATMHSAGGLISTANDMAIWLEAQIDDGVIDGRRTLPEGLVAATHVQQVGQEAEFGSYQRTGYGLGWQIGRYGDDLLIHHFGNFAGSRAHVSFMPERGIGVAVMINEDAFAGDLADLVANYAYDWFAGLPDIEAVYDGKLADLALTRDRRRTGLAQSLEARAQRPRTLSLPNAAYSGDYVSQAYGTLTVREAGDRLEAAIGVQHALAENFTAPESLRVELTPFSGEVIVFTLDADARPASLEYSGGTYVKQP